MCRETEEFGRTCECLFQLFSPQMHCMHQQPHIKVNCARKGMFNNQCSLECNWNIYIIRPLYSGTGAHKQGHAWNWYRLHLVEVMRFLSRTLCVSAVPTCFIPFHRSSPRRLSSCSASASQATGGRRRKMQPCLIRSAGYLNLMDVCVQCPDHSSVLLITLEEVDLL